MGVNAPWVLVPEAALDLDDAAEPREDEIRPAG
jgi:hypothetical protein